MEPGVAWQKDTEQSGISGSLGRNMSDSVNDYGLGTPDSQPGAPAPHTPHTDPLATGLGSPDGFDPEPEDGTEFGLGADNTQSNPPTPEESQPDKHGLGT